MAPIGGDSELLRHDPDHQLGDAAVDRRRRMAIEAYRPGHRGQKAGGIDVHCGVVLAEPNPVVARIMSSISDNAR
jgi:hypothetical protein